MAPYSGYSGTGRQHVVARIEQRGNASVNDLSAAIADEDALDVAKAIALGLAVNGLHRRLDTKRVGISVVAVHHGFHHRLDHVGRGGEVELTGIADVEVEELVAFAGDFVGDDGQDHESHSAHWPCGWQPTLWRFLE